MAGYRPPGSAPAPAASSTGAYNPSYSNNASAAGSYGTSAQQPATSAYSYGSAPAPAGGTYSSNTASTGGYNSGGYNPSAQPAPAAYSSAQPAPAAFSPSYSASATTPSTSSAMPNFSQALDVPPPVQQQTPYQSNYQQQQQQQQQQKPVTTATYSNTGSGAPFNRAPNDYGGSTSHPVPAITGGVVAVSATNSHVYAGGPTGGLVSEGNPTKCHKVDYEIKGHEMQLVEIELDPSETVIAEAGAMMFLDEGIDFKTKFGDGSEPKQKFFQKLMAAGGRLLTGESLFITHFTNRGNAKARVAFAAPFPGNIVPLNMQSFGNSIICQKDAFLCAAHGTNLKIHFNKRLGSGLFGGEGFILQKLTGDGMCFVHAGGTIIRRELRGEKLRLDTGCLVAFTEGINYDIQMVPGLKSMIFGGEGLFLATLQGTGTVWMQSLPFSRMADRIIQSAPSIGGQHQGEGSALTGQFGNVVGGGGSGLGGLIGRI